MADSDRKSAAVRYAYDRKGKGVCISCNTPLPDRKGKWPRCKDCQNEHYINNQQSVNATHKKGRAKRIAAGLCGEYGCKNVPAENRRLCARHLQLNREACRRSAEKRKRK